jgi:hypothetical protein
VPVTVTVATRASLGSADQQREDEKERGHQAPKLSALPKHYQSVASFQTNRIPGAAPVEETTRDTGVGCQFGRYLRVSSNV